MSTVKTKEPKMKTGKRINENPTFHVINTVILILTAFICILPFFNVLATALSTAGHDINFLPKGFTWYNFQYIFTDVGFWRALGVSIMVTVGGTVLSVLTMYAAAYALSKPDFPFRRGIMIFFIITMVFSAGMVPNYILVRTLGLTESPWALILPSVVQVYKLILIKSYLEGVPKDLYESAKIDGAGPWKQFVKITLPYMLFVTGPYLLTSFTGNMNNFNIIYLLSGGAPTMTHVSGVLASPGHTDLLITWIFKMITTSEPAAYNLASVIGIMVFIVVALISLVVYNVMPSTKNEEDFQ